MKTYKETMDEKNIQWRRLLLKLVCFLIFLLSLRADAANNKGKIWLTVFANHNSALDGGHAFLCVENKTAGDLYIGNYILKKNTDVYIGARGGKVKYGKEETIKEYVGGVWFDFEPVNQKSKNKGRIYKDFAYYTIQIQKSDLDIIASEMSKFGTYDFFTNNCATFARKTWNKIADKKHQIPKHTPDQPYRIKEYIVKKWKAGTAKDFLQNHKTAEDIFLMTNGLNLQPMIINTPRYFESLNTLKIVGYTVDSVTLKWNNMAYKIGRNQYNITGYELSYWVKGKKQQAKKVLLDYNKTKYQLTGLKDNTSYQFKIRGISDYRSEMSGINRGLWSGVTEQKTKKASIKLNKTSIRMAVKGTEQLSATVVGKSSKVTWTSSDKSIATVSKDGVVKAKAAGKVVITASANGLTSTCEVWIPVFQYGSGTKKDPYQVRNWKEFTHITDEDYSGCWFLQTKDIVTGKTVETDMKQRVTFVGTYNGNGHSVTVSDDTIGLTQSYYSSQYRQYITQKGYNLIHKNAEGSVIENLTVIENEGKEKVYSRYSQIISNPVSGFVGENAGTIRNCKVRLGEKGKVGCGICVTNLRNGTISKCETIGCDIEFATWNEGVIRNCTMTGGSQGFVWSNSETGLIVNCTMTGSGRNPDPPYIYELVYGFAQSNAGLIKECTVQKCRLYNSYSGSELGGIAAENSGEITGCRVLDSSITWEISDKHYNSYLSSYDDNSWIRCAGICVKNTGTINSCRVSGTSVAIKVNEQDDTFSIHSGSEIVSDNKGNVEGSIFQ